MCVWSVSRKIRATVSCNGHFMIIMVRTAGNVEGMALAQAASHWRKTNPFRHWTCVCSCEHDKNLCTSFVCEVSAKKYAQLYHVRARGPPFVNHRLHHCWKGFLCARGSTRELHADSTSKFTTACKSLLSVRTNLKLAFDLRSDCLCCQKTTWSQNTNQTPTLKIHDNDINDYNINNNDNNDNINSNTNKSSSSSPSKKLQGFSNNYARFSNNLRVPLMIRPSLNPLMHIIHKYLCIMRIAVGDPILTAMSQSYHMRIAVGDL